MAPVGTGNLQRLTDTNGAGVHQSTSTASPFLHLATKLHVPASPATIVQRLCLNQQLDLCIHHKLLLIHESLSFFLDCLPAHAHVVLSSRLPPPLPLGRWRAHGQLMELNSGDLRFSEDETQSLFRQAVDVHWSPDDVASLHKRTEGWVASLHLATLLVQGRSKAQTLDLMQSFRGDHDYIGDYLASEVLQQQAEPVRTFLLQTSILDQLDEDLCDLSRRSPNLHRATRRQKKGSRRQFGRAWLWFEATRNK